jgi:hypothetical protein
LGEGLKFGKNGSLIGLNLDAGIIWHDFNPDTPGLADVKSDVLSKNILYKITRELRKMKSITKKKEKYIKKWLITTQ